MYPNIFRRYLATLVDLAVVVLIIWVLLQVIDTSVDAPLITSNWLILLTFLLYEPILTSQAITVGQFLFRFRVRGERDYKRISLAQAYIRFFVKFLLGGYSLLKIPMDKKRRAVHDSVAESVVLNYSQLESAQSPANV